MARTTMIDVDVPSFLQPYAEAQAVKILNILPTIANENSETPYLKMARLLGLYKDLLYLFLQYVCIFESTAWLLLKGTQALAKGDKIALRVVKGRYLGSASQKGHVVYVQVPQNYQISTIRDVTIVKTLNNKKELLEELEYIAQQESNDDSNNESTFVRVKRWTAIEDDNANVNYVT